MQTLSAMGLSIKSDGSVRNVSVEGGVITHGECIPPLELAGNVDSLRIERGYARSSG